jgi:hypothetical protein
MPNRNHHRRGNAIIEFTLVGIPIIFTLISIFEMARGAWIYHTLAYALKEGVRYAVVHGQDCANLPNSCYVTIGNISSQIANAGVGLDPTQLTNVTFTSVTRTVTCPTLQSCISGGANGSTVWPAGSAGNPDTGGEWGNNITISAQYPFSSVILMFWPGARNSVFFGTFTFPATSTEQIHY